LQESTSKSSLHAADIVVGGGSCEVDLLVVDDGDAHVGNIKLNTLPIINVIKLFSSSSMF
jgi:hypothetical protein